MHKGVGRGTPIGQAIAMGLTYLSIVLSYLPDMVQSITSSHPDIDQGTAIAAALSSSVSLIWRLPPILAENGPISLLLTAFAIYQAWKMNRAGKWQVDSPLQVGAAPAAPSVGAVG